MSREIGFYGRSEQIAAISVANCDSLDKKENGRKWGQIHLFCEQNKCI
jgi:hypothetical protein